MRTCGRHAVRACNIIILPSCSVLLLLFYSINDRRISLAALESSVLLNVATGPDGTITYSFGAEADLPAPTPSTSQQAPAAVHTVPLQHTTPPPLEMTHSVGESSSVAIAAAPPAAVPKHTNGAVAAAQLDKLLHITPAMAGAASGVVSTSMPSTNSNGSNGNGYAKHGNGYTNGNGNGNGNGNNGRSSSRAVQLQPRTVVAPPQEDIHGEIEEVPIPDDLATVSYSDAPAMYILRLYSALCRANRLDDALLIMKDSIRAGRTDILRK